MWNQQLISKSRYKVSKKKNFSSPPVESPLPFGGREGGVTDPEGEKLFSLLTTPFYWSFFLDFSPLPPLWVGEESELDFCPPARGTSGWDQKRLSVCTVSSPPKGRGWVFSPAPEPEPAPEFGYLRGDRQLRGRSLLPGRNNTPAPPSRRGSRRKIKPNGEKNKIILIKKIIKKTREDISPEKTLEHSGELQ